MSEQYRSPDEKLNELARAIDEFGSKISPNGQDTPQPQSLDRKPRGLFERTVFWMVFSWSTVVGLFFLFLPAPGVLLWEKLLSAALCVMVGLPMAKILGWQAGRTVAWFRAAANRAVTKKCGPPP